MATRTHQTGMSLISLLIGATIGILLTGAAGKVYLDSRMAFAANEVVSATMENGRFAIDDLRRTLVMAGRLLQPNAPPFGDTSELLDDQDPGESDRIAVIYASKDGCDDSDSDANRCQLDCFGEEIDADNTTPYQAKIEFYLSTSAEGVRQLMCSVDGTARPLASGIETFQVLYGIDNEDFDLYPNRYINAEKVTTEGRWSPKGQVVALRIGLLASSAEMTLPQAARTVGETTFTVLDKSYTVSPPASSNKLDKYYRVYTSTISLRNLQAVEQ